MAAVRAGAALRVRAGAAVLRLAAASKRGARPLSELLPWLCLVSPGLALQKDGSLLACYRLGGVDAESADPARIDEASAAIDHALKLLDGGQFTLWWTMLHQRSGAYPGGEFGNPASARIDALYRRRFLEGRLFENRHYLSVLYTPEAGVEGLFDRAAFHASEGGRGWLSALFTAAKEGVLQRHAFAFQQALLDQAVRRMEGVLDEFSGSLADLGLKRLELAELASFLHRLASPSSPGARIRLPRWGLLDGQLGADRVIVGARHLLFEGPASSVYGAAVTVKGWPEATSPGLLDELASLRHEAVVSVMMRLLDQELARSLIRAAARYYHFTQKSLAGILKEALLKSPAQVDRGKLDLLEDAQAAAAAVTAQGARFCYANVTIVVFAPSEAEVEEAAKEALSAVNRAGFVALREGVNLLSAWAGTLPGQWAENPRRQLVACANLTDVAPVRALDPGALTNAHLSEQSGRPQPALAAFATRRGTPYFLNLHNGDVAHAIVVGPSGAGKSVFMNFLISQYQKYRPVTVIFDKDRSCMIPTVLQGGAHVNVGVEGVPLNPLRLLGERSNWPFLSRWLEILLSARGRALKAEDEKVVWEAIESLAALPPERWTLGALAALLSGALAAELRAWTHEGAHGRLFDNPEDGLSLADFTCIEMGDILRIGGAAAAAFMEYAFHVVDLKLDGRRPALLYIEEAWFMLSEPRFCARIDDWLRTMRKKNAAVVLATQSLAELRESKIFSSIVDNIPNRIFLPNGEAMAHLDVYRDKFGLTEAQVRAIAAAAPKREYYLANRSHARMLQARFPPEVLAWLRSDARALEIFERERRAGGERWRERYLEQVAAA